jgi:hypothetical protein
VVKQRRSGSEGGAAAAGALGTGAADDGDDRVDPGGGL